MSLPQLPEWVKERAGSPCVAKAGQSLGAGRQIGFTGVPSRARSTERQEHCWALPSQASQVMIHASPITFSRCHPGPGVVNGVVAEMLVLLEGLVEALA